MLSFLKKEGSLNITKYLKLDKPLIIFDIEASGLVLSMDRIIELAYIKIMANNLVAKGDLFLNPEMEISEESIVIHGITNERVKNEPTFKAKAKELWELFNNCYYSGFNVIDFDLLILKREFLRVGIDFSYSKDDIIDSKQIYHYMEPRTLSAAYRFYCNKELKGAHSAVVDVEAAADILVKQLKKYKEARDLNFLRYINSVDNTKWVDNDRKFYWRNGQAHFAFSKYRDVPLSKVLEVDRPFLEWILTAEFSEETKLIIRKALEGELPKKK